MLNFDFLKKALDQWVWIYTCHGMMNCEWCLWEVKNVQKNYGGGDFADDDDADWTWQVNSKIVGATYMNVIFPHVYTVVR